MALHLNKETLARQTTKVVFYADLRQNETEARWNSALSLDPVR